MNVLVPKIFSLNDVINSKPISNEPSTLQHELLCQQNNRHLKIFLKNMNKNVSNNNIFCDGCAYGKQYRQDFMRMLKGISKFTK